MIKLFSPYIPPETSQAVADVLASGQIAQGSKVEEFEALFHRMFLEKYPISVNSGTAALELAYEIIDLQPGDEVITTPLTCAATNLPLLRRGCKIIWADILEDTLCIDPMDVHNKITDATRAVVQVHLGGVEANVGWLPIPTVSDAAQALGIFSGDYTCCSFQAIKHITTGDGGMLCVSSEYDYQRAKLLRWFGIDRERYVKPDWESYRTRMMCFDIRMLGTKRHMNDLAAAMGIAGLGRYDEVIAHRRYLFSIYKDKLSDIPGLKIVDGETNVCWLMTVLVENRDGFAKKLFEAGVETNVVQVRNDTYKVFGGKRADLPVMNKIESKYISLPIGMHITEEQVEHIASTIQGGW